MTIKDFIVPDKHPYDMLNGYTHGYEKEATLAFVLKSALTAGDLYAAVTTTHEHPTMVTDGLLEKVGDSQYRLTKKSIGLLYAHFGAP